MPDFIENELPRAELPLQPEKGPDFNREAETPAERPLQTEKISEAVQPVPIVVSTPAVPIATDPTIASIETILSEDLVEHYKSMPPDVQARFKKKGEETVSRLSVLVGRTTIKAKEVLMLIVGWLRFIPGVSKYFLEQESKIKADKILELHRRNHGG